jgi:hypothetical protein
LAALSSPGYGPIDGQQAYLYIVAVEVDVLNWPLAERRLAPATTER